MVEGLLRQPFGLATLRLVVIGYARERAAARRCSRCCAGARSSALLAELLPEQAAELDGLARPPRRARRRYALEPSLDLLVLGARACLIPGAGPWPLLAALPGAAWGLAAWRSAGWRLAGGRLRVRFRWLAATRCSRRPRTASPTRWPRPRSSAAESWPTRGGLRQGDQRPVRHLDARVAWRLWEEIGALR